MASAARPAMSPASVTSRAASSMLFPRSTASASSTRIDLGPTQPTAILTSSTDLRASSAMTCSATPALGRSR